MVSRNRIPRIALLAACLLPAAAGFGQDLYLSQRPLPYTTHADCGHSWVELTTDHLYTPGPFGEEELVPLFEPTLARLVAIKQTCDTRIFTFELADGRQGYLELPEDHPTHRYWHPMPGATPAIAFYTP